MTRNQTTLAASAGATLVFAGAGRVRVIDNSNTLKFALDSSMASEWFGSDFPEGGSGTGAAFSTSEPIEIWARNPDAGAAHTVTIWNWHP